MGATINGTLINEDNSSPLLDSSMDILAFSMAGTGKLNDRFREGASVNSVLEAIRLVNKKKEQRGSHYPEIHIAYLLLRSGLEEIEALPEMLAGLGVKEVVVSTLDFVPSSVLKEETVIPRSDSEYNYVSGKLKETAVECRRLNMNFEYYIFSESEPRFSCTEDPGQALFVSSDGSVSPCVFTNLPVEQASAYVLKREEGEHEWKETSVARLVFGNINTESLTSIWSKKEYIVFRNSFYETPLPCLRCPKLYLS